MSQIRLFFETSEELAKKFIVKLEPYFDDEGFTHSIFETDEEKRLWSFSIYLFEEDKERTQQLIENEMQNVGIKATLGEEQLADDGWVEKTLSELAPVYAGRFIVHGSHDADLVKPHQIPIQIDAGLAFGTGHHGTTAGCLNMIEKELRSAKPANALDLGSGTGVLAIAIAKAAKIPVLASDIDFVAQKVAEDNAKLNGASQFVRSITSTGFNNVEFKAWTPFDLIVANILAGPLQKLARDVAHHLSENATVILSGLLPHQKARILSSYRQHGIVLKHAHIQDGWLTLVLKN